MRKAETAGLDRDATKALTLATENLRAMRAIVRKLPEGEERSIASEFVEGSSLSALAGRYGVTPETIRTRLQTLGIPPRPATFREPDFYRAKAERAREEATRLEAIATIVQGAVIPPRTLLARTTGGT
jgi:hypothetical protein